METALTTTTLDATFTDVAGQISRKSKSVYMSDMKAFVTWMHVQALTPDTLTRSSIIAYREYLASRYAKATANRMLMVVRHLLDEQVNNGTRAVNPAKDVRGFKLDNETPHTALKQSEARELLSAVDRSTIKGTRDYALLSLLLRTGIRRSECASLTIGDLQIQQGHHVAVIQHGKGDKRRVAKLPVDVFRSIQAYIEAAGRTDSPPSAPLFTGFTKGDKPTTQGISDKLIERVVKHYAERIGVDKLTPHGLRASFITLALENKAALHQVQYAAGHADPRTTERYQRRKLNLDDNAVDYIKL